MRAVDSTPPSPSPIDLEVDIPVLHRSYAVAMWGCMTVQVWNGAVRPERVDAVVREARRGVERWPAGGGLTLIVGPDTGLPNADVRRRVSAALRELGGHIHCAAVVVEGSGLLAATTRSVVSLMFLASNRHIRLRVFGSIEEAARWQTDNVDTETPLPAEAFSRVLRDVTSRQAQVRYGDQGPP